MWEGWFTYDPKPLPVPPPSECIMKNDCKLSHFSAAEWNSSSRASWCFGPYLTQTVT
jgi:hypothetical protein